MYNTDRINQSNPEARHGLLFKRSLSNVGIMPYTYGEYQRQVCEEPSVNQNGTLVKSTVVWYLTQIAEIEALPMSVSDDLMSAEAQSKMDEYVKAQFDSYNDPRFILTDQDQIDAEHDRFMALHNATCEYEEGN